MPTGITEGSVFTLGVLKPFMDSVPVFDEAPSLTAYKGPMEESELWLFGSFCS
jgi:hypothetical protein